MKDQPEFPALALLAARGLLAPDTWKCKRAQVSLKATIVFFRPTPYSFRQVVQHVSKHVAYEIN